MSKTLIVNLYGGPGTGKSTTAALLFALLKQAGYNAELVREYVKEWAWENRHPGPFDQFYFFGKQSRKESLLYGKVDVIVTDSPVMLSAFYADMYASHRTAHGIKEVVRAFYEESEKAGFHHVHTFLKRTKEYNAKGRFQTADEAKALDDKMWRFLENMGMEVDFFGTDEKEVKELFGFAKLAYAFHTKKG
jgi:hypothetical protein